MGKSRRFQLSPLHEGRRCISKTQHRRFKFQLSPLHEGRLIELPLYTQAVHFNSRPYTRGDLWIPTKQKSLENFNSRPYTRGDVFNCAIKHHPHISTLAPTRGATMPFCFPATDKSYFNSRPYTRGDLRKPQAFTWNSEFQLSPLHEGRPMDSNKAEILRKFQLSPLHEGRRFQLRYQTSSTYFNSRPYTRGDHAFLFSCD